MVSHSELKELLNSPLCPNKEKAEQAVKSTNVLGSAEGEDTRQTAASKIRETD